MKSRALTLYWRPACSLCEAMVQELQPVREALDLRLVLVDVDTDPALQQRYGTRVPVLTAQDEVLCEYFLEPDKVQRYFSAC